MIVRCTSDVPPAIEAAFDHSHCRCQKPGRIVVGAPHSGAAAPTTSSARAEKRLGHVGQASFVMLDSGPARCPS